MAMEHVEVFEERRAHWRWRYRDGNGAAVLSNHSYDDPMQAMLAARSAYPDLDVEDDREILYGTAPAARDKKDILVVVVAILVALGVIWWRRRAQDESEDVA
jgi:hypothetical protein